MSVRSNVLLLALVGGAAHPSEGQNLEVVADNSELAQGISNAVSHNGFANVATSRVCFFLCANKQTPLYTKLHDILHNELHDQLHNRPHNQPHDQKLFGRVHLADQTIESLEESGDWWHIDYTVFKWRQYHSSAPTRLDAVRRLRGFKYRSITAGQADVQPSCTWHNANDAAALTANDLRYSCPDGSFFHRFQTDTDPSDMVAGNPLRIRCCRGAATARHGRCVLERPFVNGRREMVLGCRALDGRSITGITFEGSSTEITAVRCCEQTQDPLTGPPAGTAILKRSTHGVDPRSVSEFAFQQIPSDASSMLTGFTQPVSAHTRDIGVWQWHNFATAHLHTPAGLEYTADTIECENVVPDQHPQLGPNGIAFGLPASSLPAVTLNCSEGKFVHRWLLNGSQVDGRYYIGVGPGLKCCGVPNVVLTDCDDVVLRRQQPFPVLRLCRGRGKQSQSGRWRNLRRGEHHRH